MTTMQDLEAGGRRMAALLRQRDISLVLAESCTGGLIAATLATIPGISKHFAGSAVVYQIETKASWLGIPHALFENPGPVSAEVAIEMAQGVLARTPQAQIAASVTGHLGPDAPAEQDGLMYTAVALRDGATGTAGPDSPFVLRRHVLTAGTDGATNGTGDSLRTRRQREATAFVLALVCTVLEEGLNGHAVAT